MTTTTEYSVIWTGDRRGAHAGLLCVDPVRPAPPLMPDDRDKRARPEPAPPSAARAKGPATRFSEAELRDAGDLLRAVLGGHGQVLRPRFMADLTGLPEAIVLDALARLGARGVVQRASVLRHGALVIGYRAGEGC